MIHFNCNIKLISYISILTYIPNMFAWGGCHFCTQSHFCTATFLHVITFSRRYICIFMIFFWLFINLFQFQLWVIDWRIRKSFDEKRVVRISDSPAVAPTLETECEIENFLLDNTQGQPLVLRSYSRSSEECNLL